MSNTKGLSFPPLNLIFFKNSRCIAFLWVHRPQPHLCLPKLIKHLATLKLTQSLRKSIWRHIWVWVVNAVSFKGIKQVVLKQWTFEVCQVFLIYDTLSRNLNTHGVQGVILSLVNVKWSSAHREELHWIHSEYHNVNKNKWAMSQTHKI